MITKKKNDHWHNLHRPHYDTVNHKFTSGETTQTHR